MSEKQVYVAIAAVTKEMSKFGISKDRKNQQQGYKFRGIDDVYNALSPLLADNNLCIIPRMIERELIERQTQKGGVLFYVTVKAEFDFVSAIDGSMHTAVTYGEAMDSADKATNKAMSAAYKYAAFQTFCIPTEGDNDADATTHEVAPLAQRMADDPDVKEDMANLGYDANAVYDNALNELNACIDAEMLANWVKVNKTTRRLSGLPKDLKDDITTNYNKLKQHFADGF